MDVPRTLPAAISDGEALVTASNPSPTIHDTPPADGEAVETMRDGAALMEETKETTPLRVKCVYKRGGVCKEHGKGAKKHSRPVVTREVGPGGEIVVTKSKKMFYVCDLSLERGRRLRQSRLSFMNTPERPSGMTDTQDDNLNISDASTEGQNFINRGDVRRGLVDEK